MRDIGELGERMLHLWAAQAQMTANKAHQDRTGWDFILELPIPRQTGSSWSLPLDHQLSPVQCLLQVKATDGQPGRWSMKLSNLRRLMCSPLPAFVLVLEFGGQNECQRAFLMHIGEAQVRRILRRLREIGTNTVEPALHRSTLSLSYGSGDALPTNDGPGLINAILQHVPDSYAYIRSKHELLKSAGYEEGGQVVEALVRLPRDPEGTATQDRLVNWSLGLVGDIMIEPGAKIYDHRFGIRHPEPLATIPTKAAMVPNPVGTGLVRLRTISGEQQCTLETEAFTSESVAIILPDAQHKIRLKTRFVDFILPAADDLKSWRILTRVLEPDTPISLVDLREFADFINLVGAAIPDGGFDLEVHIDSIRFSGRIHLLSPPHTDLLRLGMAIRAALRISERVGIAKNILTSINELFLQTAEIQAIDAALRSDPLGGRFDFWSRTDESIPTVGCCPFVFDARVGGNLVLLACKYSGRIEQTGAVDGARRQYVLHVDSLFTTYVQVFGPGEVPHRSKLELLRMTAASCDPLDVIRWWEEHETDNVVSSDSD